MACLVEWEGSATGSKLAAVSCAEFAAEPGETTGEGQRKRSKELQVRADMLNTAGCTASAFEAARQGSSSPGSSDSSSGSSTLSGRSSSSGSSLGYQSLLRSDSRSNSRSVGSLIGSGRYTGLADEHSTTGVELTDAKQNGNAEIGRLRSGVEDNGMLSAKASKTSSMARRPLMAFRDPSLEQGYYAWHARQRWQARQHCSA